MRKQREGVSGERTHIGKRLARLSREAAAAQEGVGSDQVRLRLDGQDYGGL